MATRKNSTILLTKEEAQAARGWITLDAKGKTLGRFASEVAQILRGKHKTTFTPNADSGDGVIIINADQIAVSGNKEAQKVYRHYTGHMGGLREIPYRTMMQRKPTYIIRRAVQGMMPKTKLGKAQLKRLRIFAGDTHNQQAQKPLSVEV
ncbi:50S ribosomal protein L13 [Candidatus Neptunochlamydia vexilliferae]|uniref:Large ribosomal subunit protein uL13 n=1 Tax=Candidatus Neptunichlamydia vexilliferae TaxID=1651774 RepID=A0ABS0AZZ0_9BACT|nr:50S ribosomal protein L13 [Candidatus Neptunochlamydia vexilliferae]MBF5059520.1 50S ribosomal protein L13 [Candidatus Neptunochlamydia vexilliferae]